MEEQQASIARIERNVSPELKEEFAIWRLVLERMATLEEIERSWSIDDVMRANALLDMRSDLAIKPVKGSRP